MDLQVKGKVAIITGAGQGVGRCIAHTLAAEGARVVVNDFYGNRAESVAKEIKGAGGEALGIQADVTDFEQIKGMVADAEKALGPVDILVNNAGVPIPIREGKMARTLFVDSEPLAWQKQIDLNMYGCLNCTYAVIHSMIERKEGKIVSVISEAGRTGEYNLAVYSGAKAGILGFTKALAREVGRHRINVNCIAIGATAHEGVKDVLDPDATPETDERLKKMLKVYPLGRGLGRIGRPSDAANAVAFLVSPRAVFITGQCLSVSGGFSMVS
jgi:2-hydroxycyclohexanecarboxyl-CoA dehydrogenase